MAQQNIAIQDPSFNNAELRESEERYRTLFESIDEGFCIIEKIEGKTGEALDFRFVEANPAFAALTGLSDVAGRTLRQVFPDEFEERILTYDTVLRTGVPIRVEREFVAWGRVLELHAFRVAHETQGRVAINLQDITGRKHAEELVARQAAELATLYATAPVGLFFFDTDLRYVRVNPAMAELNGLPAELHIGRTLRELLTPELADVVEPQVRQVLETGQPVLNCEVHGATAPRCSEQQRHWLVSYYPVRAGDGTIRGVHGAVQEITERMQAQAALRESEAFSRSIVKSSRDCIKVLDLAGNLLSMESGQELLGIEDIRPFLNKSWIDFWEGEKDKQTAQAAVASAAAGGTGSFVGFSRTLRGEPKWWDVVISPISGTDGKPARLLAVSRDVTERQQVNDDLRESEQRLRILVTASSDVIYRMGPDWREMRQLHGQNFIADTTAPNANWLHEYIHPDDQQRVMAVIHEAIRTKSLFEMEHQVRTMDGSLGWTFSRAVPLLDAKGEIVEWFGTASDVTEQKRAAQALRESELRYRNLFNSIDEGFAILEIIFDEEKQARDYRFLEVNPAFEKQSGIVDALGKRIREFTPDQDAPSIEIYGQVLLTGEPSRFVNEVKALGRYFDVYATRLGGPDSRRVAVVLNDITERKEAEEALRESEARLRAMVLASSDLICRMNPDWSEMLQIYDKDFVVSTHVANPNWLQNFVYQADQPQLIAAVNDAIRTKSLFEMEHRVRRADGSWGWMLSRAVPLLNASGEIVEWFGTGSDVTEKKRAEQALRESQARYRSLFNSMDEGFCIMDMMFDENEKPVDYRFLEVNPAFEKQSGIHDATGKRMRELAPDTEGHWFEIFGRVALTGEAVSFVSEAKALGDRWFDVNAFRLGGPESRKVAFFFNNITERKKAAEALRQSEERLQLAAEAANFGMYDRDLHGAYFHIAGQLKQMLGYEPDAPLDHAQVMSHIHPDDRLAGVAAFQRACDPVGDGHIVAEQRIVRRDGAVRWILTVGQVLFENSAPRRSIGFWVDITERKAAELALRAANTDLERRVEERTQALADKARQLERASRVKSEFLASMSHELRTPLNGIIGFTEFLHDEKPGPLLPKQKEYLGDVLDSARHLLELINEVLDIATVEAGKIEFHPSSFSVAQAIEDACTVIQGSADKKRIALRIEVAGRLDAVNLDPLRFKQVLYNLLSNAVKFSNEGGRVEIHARRLAPGQLEVQVRDTGIGIKAADLGRLFTEFGRFDSGATRRAEGTGLGLALTKKLVELQGGRIGVQSVAGEGCVFTVVLPLLTGQAVAGQPA